jgi:hypothetical protein
MPRACSRGEAACAAVRIFEWADWHKLSTEEYVFSYKDWKKKRYAEDAEFRERTRAYNRAYHAAHKDEINALRRRRWVEDPRRKEQQRRSYRPQNWRKYYYGMSQEDYDRLVARQGGACAICGKRPAKALCVDHCHATGKIRGLLCRKCNLGIGHLDDSPSVMRAAIAYLSGCCEDAPVQSAPQCALACASRGPTCVDAAQDLRGKRNRVKPQSCRYRIPAFARSRAPGREKEPIRRSQRSRGAALPYRRRHAPRRSAFHEADEIADDHHLISHVVRNLDADELVLDRDHQLEAIEPVSAEIFDEMSFVRDTFGSHAETAGNEIADLGGNAVARHRCPPRKALDSHDESPRFMQEP